MIFLVFYKSVTNRPMDGRTDGLTDRRADGQTLLQRSVDASKNEGVCLSSAGTRFRAPERLLINLRGEDEIREAAQ